jgi:hypothetical protein
MKDKLTKGFKILILAKKNADVNSNTSLEQNVYIVSLKLQRKLDISGWKLKPTHIYRNRCPKALSFSKLKFYHKLEFKFYF